MTGIALEWSAAEHRWLRPLTSMHMQSCHDMTISMNTELLALHAWSSDIVRRQVFICVFFTIKLHYKLNDACTALAQNYNLITYNHPHQLIIKRHSSGVLHWKVSNSVLWAIPLLYNVSVLTRHSPLNGPIVLLVCIHVRIQLLHTQKMTTPSANHFNQILSSQYIIL